MATLGSPSHLPYPSIAMLLLLLLLVMVATLPTAFSQDTIADCSPRLMALMPCAPFVQGMAPVPAKSCCDNLNQLYNLQPACLCLLLNDTSSLTAFPINRTLALQLPDLCKLHANTAACSASQVSLGAKNNASVAASPEETPTIPVSPRSSIMGLGLGRSSAGRMKPQGLLAVVTFAAIMLPRLGLLDQV